MGAGWNPTGCDRLVLLLFLSVQVHIGQALPSDAFCPVAGTDCTDIKIKNPGATSGVYTIQPDEVKKPFKVYCEMRSDGGWAVFQRRTGGLVSFKRNWAAYKWGFGKQDADHWLGLRHLWVITKLNKSRWVLRVELCDFEGGSVFAEYKDFKLGSVKNNYSLNVGNYSGSAGDAIRGTTKGISQNGFGFSTKDRDSDGCSPCIFGDIATESCSQDEDGAGWWFSSCGDASLNGDWHSVGEHLGWRSGLHWRTWKGPGPYSVRATRMMVKRI